MSVGASDHFTFSSAAAWTALYSSGATTPTKFPFWTTWAPGCARSTSGRATASVAPADWAAWPRGRTTRPWSMPGTRTLWEYVVSPVTMAGMSIRGARVPISRYLRGSVSTGFTDAIVLPKVLPAMRSEYLTVLPPPVTTPSVTLRPAAGTPSWVDAAASSSVRAAAAAPRMLVALIAVRVEELAAANDEIETLVSSWTALTWSSERPSSSAAIWRTTVGEPCPISVQPWNSVAVLSGLI